MSATLTAIGALLFLASGIPSLTRTRAGHLASVLISVAGAITGLAGCVSGLTGPATQLDLAWNVPGGAISIRLDTLSAFFAAPVFLLSGVGAVYSERYWPWSTHRAAYVRVFFGLLTGSLAIVMTAGSTMLFLAAWEIVTASSFFLIVSDDISDDVKRAGWIYLGVSHVAALCLFGLVAILHSATGGWTFAPLDAATASGTAGQAILWLAVIAFGIKAGLMPLHVWLPGAHAAAPSHVSALMSGVVIKMGIYGLVRVISLYPAPSARFGTVLLVLGIVSSVLGVAFALAQHDLKRLLAYHSIENIGIIVTGIGVSVIARAYGMPAIAMLGLAGGLLHVWNHGLFKALLFFGAGSAIHATHTREIDRMGGLAQKMPWTAASFLVGAIAICGLPPLNGFVSEWLLYVSGFQSVHRPAIDATWLLLVFVAPALALTGALALACFVKAFGAVFLGSARSKSAENAHEAEPAMWGSMLPLVIACIAIGLVPATLAPMLERVVNEASGIQATGLAETLAPVQTMSLVIAAVVVAFGILVARRARRNAASTVTWDCGYAKPGPTMQYTSSSFARTLVEVFSWAMPSESHVPHTVPLFPKEEQMHTHVPDTVLEHAMLPALRRIREALMHTHVLQGGRVQIYLLYTGVTLIAFLAWSAR